MDINNLLTSIVRNQLTGFIAEKLNITEDQAAKLVAIAIPILLAALAKNAKKPAEAQNISTALEEHDGSILNDILGSLATPQVSQDGQKIVSHILGPKTSGVTQKISKESGLKNSQVNTALALIAPILMGTLGQKQAQEQNPVVSLLKGFLN